jgi:Fe-S cluster assembly iron-binding protein IscA
LVSFTIFIPCLYSSAQDVLEITGPADAFEGENVEFTVTLNGEPIQARVAFGDISPANYSNSSTGKVTFTTPSVPYDDKEYVVTASLLGELSASHSILVKNRTGMLTIEFSTDYVIETEEFTVTVKERDEPVMGASVWFNSAVHVSDASGTITLLAPDVLVTTNYGITVNKTGYKSSSSMITIHDDDRGQRLMEVINPFIVEPGNENVEIKVISSHGGLEGTSIDLYYEGQKYAEYNTDGAGKAYIGTPSVNNDNYFSLIVEKEGYSTYYLEEEFIISLFERDFTYDLDVNVVPSEMYEGELVTVEVSNDVGLGVEGVSIWRGAVELDGSTDSEGVLSFIAPSVFMDREYYLYAVKEGCNFAEATITIRDKSNGQEQLKIESQNTVNESELFSVVVKDKSNILLSNVLVTFNSEQKTTNEYGIVMFVAPNVTSTSFYLMEASKLGYLPASSSIEIIDFEDSNGAASTELEICVEPSIIENEAFRVTVRDDQSNLIAGVQVTFKGTSLETDFKGEVTFSAPDVGWDEIHNIRATKSGYSSASAEITIKNVEGFQYWYLIIVVIAISIIGIAAYFRYGWVF